MTIHIFGNGNLSFDDFLKYYEAPLLPYLSDKSVHFSVCDFRGVDTLVMELLKSKSANVSVYHMSETPRYLPDKYKTKVSQWQLIGGFENDEDRDLAAIDNCTHFLAIDFNSNQKRISGTAKNISWCEHKNKISLL